MGFRDKISKRRYIGGFLNSPNVYEVETRDYTGKSAFESLRGGTQTEVTEKTILNIPTAASCVDLISGSIAQLPIYLYKENESTGDVERIVDDHRVFLLNNEPNEHLTGYDYKKQMVKDFVIHGKTYTYLDRSGNDIESLYPLPVENIEVKKYIKGKGCNYTADIIYKINHEDADNSIEEVYKPYELLTVLRNTKDGIRGQGVIEQGKRTFELALNENEYTANIFDKGALPLGVLETDGRLSEPTANRLRQSWENIYGGVKNSGKTVILEEGLKYKPLSLSPNDLRLNEGRKISNEEICKLFNVPISLVASEKGYGNTEQDGLHFMKYCLSPIIACIESQLDRSLLLEEEKMSGYYFRFDLSELMRTTEKERYEAVKIGMEIGALSINESRAKLDMPPLDKDYIMMNLGNVFYDVETGEFIVPNTGQNVEGSEDDVAEDDIQKDDVVQDDKVEENEDKSQV